ncbi:hypothetical protein PYJP_06890 [Pyrofollis japonicus]|uniref:hypothetical protein n=1 Tax=Pyrofollis japonicus TaxID=3060460 RepID=UPI00295B0402|nr:hypothetical protein [Pyrofollis japonicus]BEP17337.1 hypothetical protein PYJP_06890 [Pyrofollis japonicus]
MAALLQPHPGIDALHDIKLYRHLYTLTDPERWDFLKRRVLLYTIGIAAVAIFVVTILAASSKSAASSIGIKIAVTEPPRLTTITHPIGRQNVTVWMLGFDAIIDGSRLAHPAPIEGVDVYVKVALGNNSTMWLRAEKGIIGGIEYMWYGDSIVVPGEEARLHVSVYTPEDEKPLAVIVTVHLEGYGTVYSNVAKLASR